MLQKLGYNPDEYPPDYGKPDSNIKENTDHIKNNEEFWRKRSLEVRQMSRPPRNYAFEKFDRNNNGSTNNKDLLYKQGEGGDSVKHMTELERNNEQPGEDHVVGGENIGDNAANGDDHVINSDTNSDKGDKALQYRDKEADADIQSWYEAFPFVCISTLLLLYSESACLP